MKGKILVIIILIALLIVAPKIKSKAETSMKSYLNEKGLPIGISNNNPLNIRRTSTTWIGENTNYSGAFTQFRALIYGTRAGIKNLKTIYNRGNKTPRKIISIWAPSGDGDNDPFSYAAIVAEGMGITMDTEFKFTYDNVRRMIQTMCRVEQGRNYVADSDFAAAWYIAF